MKQPVSDKTGKRFGRLTVIRKSDRVHDSKGRSRTYWVCQCDCGKIVEKRSDALKIPVPSCGCYTRERHSENMRKIMTGRIKYGDSRERIHNIWYLMKYRCEDESSPAYHNYGGRGITICDEWSNGIDGYFKFKEWAFENGYDESLTLDRIDNNLGYSPDNCRWTGIITQANNKRSNILYELEGCSKTLAQWAREYDIAYKTLHCRVVRYGWDLKRALTTPVRQSARIA